MKIVIRAGGVGSRLWPMSRINNPKQFQKIVGDKTMVRTTYERIAPLLKDPADLFLSVNYAFVAKAKKEIPEIPEANFIIETDTRNTGPAICLEVAYLEKFCAPDEVIASITSDDYISDDRAFRSLLLTSEEFIKEKPDYILTPAIRPDYPDTGYTYFKAGKNLRKSGEEIIYSVADVVEKPNSEFCQDLIKTGVYFCHTGIYLWQFSHIRELFMANQPGMYEICQKVAALLSGKNKNFKKAEQLYGQLEKISIETALTDKIDKLAMSVSNRIGWSDLGKWHVVKRVLQKNDRSNVTKGDVYTQNAANNIIFSDSPKKIIVVNDIKDLAIIDTADALYVSSLSNSAEVKKIINKLKIQGQQKYL